MRLPQYVELPELMAERAVQVLNHRNMGARYVEVFLSSEGEMNQANVSQPVANLEAGSCPIVIPLTRAFQCDRRLGQVNFRKSPFFGAKGVSSFSFLSLQAQVSLTF